MKSKKSYGKILGTFIAHEVCAVVTESFGIAAIINGINSVKRKEKGGVTSIIGGALMIGAGIVSWKAADEVSDEEIHEMVFGTDSSDDDESHSFIAPEVLEKMANSEKPQMTQKELSELLQK